MMGISKIVGKNRSKKRAGRRYETFLYVQTNVVFKKKLNSSNGCTNRHTFVENTERLINQERGGLIIFTYF